MTAGPGDSITGHAHRPQPADEDLGRAVDDALLAMAYGRLRQSVYLTIAVCIIFVTLFWSFFPSNQKVVWVSAMLSISALRYFLWRAYARSGPSGVSHARWRRLFFASALAAGLSWGYGPLMLMPAAGHNESMLLSLAVLAVSAVSMSAMGEQLKAMLAFQSAALVPCIGALAATGGSVEMMGAAVLFAGMVSLMIVGRKSSASTRSLIETELRLSRSIAATNEARERAEAASQAKTRFLANMSHELRSPLNAVIGAAQLMKAGESDPERQEQLVEAIERSGTNLLGLIDNILDLSRIEAGEHALVAQDFHLFDCVDAVLATVGLATRAKGLQLACIADPALPAWRHGDAACLRQILLNLLGNAVKFTPAGELVVRLEAGAAPDGVRITVSDSGIGIPARALAHIFEPFQQADDSSRRRFGGSGLGLAIVRQLIEAMGGAVAVQSDPGNGSVFTLTLPLPPANRVPPPGANVRLRVAYVEPHPASADALHAMLVRMGFDAQRCTTEQQVFNWWDDVQGDPEHARLLICTDTPPSAAMMSLAIERMGPEHVVGMSARESQAHDPAHPHASAVRMLLKPVSRSTLSSRLLAGTVRRPAPAQAPTPLPMAVAAPPAAAHVLVVEDDALNRTIVCAMLRHAGYDVSMAQDGQSALAALAARDFDLVLMDWHMPDMDGLEVTRRLRAGAASEAARHVPIVALTANAFAEDRAACLQAGMNDYLSKPVLAASLVAMVAHWTRDSPSLPAAAAP
jgi:two-component system sensor histidine kinase BarA